MSEISRGRRLAYGLIATFLVLVIFEQGLRIIGFKYKRAVSYMQFNYPRPHTLHKIYRTDPELLWALIPGYDFGGGMPPINKQGFRGPHFIKDKTPGVLRIACIGDSVTFGRPETAYAIELQIELNERLGRPVEVMNFGVTGYTSFQGRKLLPLVLAEYKPDMVYMMYGWNDHWWARGFADKDQIVNEPVEDALGPVREFKLYQLLHLGRDLVKKKTKKDRPRVFRVSPEDYEDNLRTMIGLCKQAGAVPLIGTTPSAISTGLVPNFLMETGSIRFVEDLAKYHAQYNDIVREVTANEDTLMIDLDLIYLNRDVTTLFDDPAMDLLHPNVKGLELIGESLAGAIEALERKGEEGRRK